MKASDSVMRSASSSKSLGGWRGRSHGPAMHLVQVGETARQARSRFSVAAELE
jgi:hypothetical protein